MATTEEMNRDIHEYMGRKFVLLKKKNPNSGFWDDEHSSVKSAELALSAESDYWKPLLFVGMKGDCDYNSSWNTLMPVWAKLRKQLDERNNNFFGFNWGKVKRDIASAITECDTPKEAHSLIHSAIVFLNNNKK